jgi:hypothetical protein
MARPVMGGAIFIGSGEGDKPKMKMKMNKASSLIQL